MRDRAMVLGCVAAAFLGMLSLSATPATPVRAAVLSGQPQSLQSARVHSLTGASIRAVSLF